MVASDPLILTQWVEDSGKVLITAERSNRMTKVSGKLTTMQTNVLSVLLRERIAEFGDMLIPKPSAGPIRRVAADERFKDAGIAVDIYMGPLVLCLFAPDWLVGNTDGPNLPALADRFAKRFKEVRRAQRWHLDRFTRARRMIDAAIARSSAGMTLLSLTTVPQRIDNNLTGCYLQFEANVSMLTEGLQPYVQSIVGWTPRELTSTIAHYASQQRIRLRVSVRLKASSAILEIDEMAERAIALTGASLAKCADVLLAKCDRQNGVGREHTLAEFAGGKVSVHLRNGCIIASFSLVGVGFVAGREFIIDHVLPDVVTHALTGRDADAIVAHPLLRGFRVVSAKPLFNDLTIVRLRVKRRFVSSAELGKHLPLAA